uniref:Uncharacterized protein n=1 Tax=Octopus bimaculoides TaxID=37653 RepID=A0A0L8GZR2_OCTBM
MSSNVWFMFLLSFTMVYTNCFSFIFLYSCCLFLKQLTLLKIFRNAILKSRLNIMIRYGLTELFVKAKNVVNKSAR